MLKSLALAFSCFSRIPMPKMEWDQQNMRFMLAWFPAVGLVVGLITAAWWFAAEALGFGMVLKAAGVALVPLLVTGGFHLDGFADVIDALASNAAPERKREILKDSHIGAFAAMGVAMYVLAYFAIATELPEGWKVAALLVCLNVMPRCGSGFASTLFNGNGSGGMLSCFHDSAHVRVTIGALVIVFALTVACALVVSLPCGLAMAACEVLLLVWLNWFAKRTFGGMSGDVAGFFLQVCELALLACIVIVAKVVGL